MPAGARNVAATIGRRLPAVLTLAMLGGLAAWGWQNDWKLPAVSAPATTEARGKDGAAKADDRDPAGSTNVASPAGQVRRITLDSDDAAKKAGFDYQKVQVRPMAQYVTALGMIDYEPSHYARLTTRATGAVWRVEKEIGEPVAKGEALAYIDAIDVGRAKSAFLQSVTRFRMDEKNAQIKRDLDKQGAASEYAVREAEFALQKARFALAGDQQTLLNLGLPVRLSAIAKLSADQLAHHVRVMGLPRRLLEDKAIDTEVLTANLLPLNAPFAGVVVQRNVAPGEVVQASDPKALFVVADVTRLHIDLDVNPGDMAGVRPGLKVLFAPDGTRSETATAWLTHISPEVDEKTRRVRIHAQLANPGGKLRPNTFGTGRILIREQPRALVVPADALQSDGDTQYVFVRTSETTFEARPVQVGMRDSGFVEVSAVLAGEEVVTTGSFTLKSELLKERIAGADD